MSRLEADLFAAVNAVASVSSSGLSAAPAGAPDASPSRGGGAAAAAAAGTPAGGDKALLAAVTSQRDRFRSRAEALEVELAAAQQAREQAEAAAQKAVADRDELYNKVRFLEAFAAGTVRQVQCARASFSRTIYACCRESALRNEKWVGKLENKLRARSKLSPSSADRDGRGQGRCSRRPRRSEDKLWPAALCSGGRRRPGRRRAGGRGARRPGGPQAEAGAGDVLRREPGCGCGSGEAEGRAASAGGPR